MATAKESSGGEPPVRTIEADLFKTEHCEAILRLLDAYAADPMGNGEPLPDEVLVRLIPGLRRHPTTLVFLAYEGAEAVGLAVCFLGFSTFAAKPLVNLHDLAVLPEKRGRGIGSLLLAAIEEKANALGCCKVTLEVLENNARAKGLYETRGFSQARYGDDAGGALFYAKKLSY